MTLDAGSWLDTFLRSTLGKSPEERAAALEADEDAAEVHDEVVAQVWTWEVEGSGFKIRESASCGWGR